MPLLCSRCSQPSSLPQLIDGLIVDAGRGALELHGQTVMCTPREFALVEYLALRAGWYIPACQIVEAVWGPEYAGPGMSKCVHVNVSRLRRKLAAHLGVDPCRYLHSRTCGQGFMVPLAGQDPRPCRCRPGWQSDA